MRNANRVIFRQLFTMILFLQPSLIMCDENDPPITWGEVPIEQLQMKSYPKDTNATAVILCDYGEVTFDSDYHLLFTRHARIKIFTKAGFKFGTHEIQYKKSEKIQSVNELEGMTYNLAPDGSIIQTELESESIFDEELTEGWWQKKFSFPMLTPGCVIEYRYTIESRHPMYLPNWYFQTDEPTLWSEYRVKAPRRFRYVAVTNTYHPFETSEVQFIRVPQMTSYRMSSETIEYFHYIIKDMPALREEPYITTVDDYKTHVDFQLAEINWPDEFPIKVLNSWDKVAEDLDGQEHFGKQFDGFGDIRERTESLIQGLTDEEKKIHAVYEFVRTTMVWDGRKRIFSDRDLDEVLEAKTGNSAEINMLLISMLREAGIQAQPVLISTRSHGRIQQLYPIIEQFDYLIVRVTLDDKRLLCDATERFQPLGVLPVRALNHVGFLVDGTNYEWVNVEPDNKTKSITVATLRLDSAGAIKGKIQKSFTGYTALNEREKLSETKLDEYVKSLLKAEAFGLQLDSVTASNADDVQLPFSIEAGISSTLCTQVLRDNIYLVPLLMDRSTENPFKTEKRRFPVDYAYPHSAVFNFQLTLPEGYSLKDIPKDIEFSLPQSGGSYTRTTTQVGGIVNITVMFSVARTVFEPKVYQELRESYERMITAEGEQLVFQKKGGPKTDIIKKTK